MRSRSTKSLAGTGLRYALAATLVSAATASALPRAYDRSLDNAFPPIGSQIGGSCTGWSTTYYGAGFVLAKWQGWNAKTGGTQYRCSPVWAFNHMGNHSEGGSYLDNFNFQIKHGLGRWSEFYGTELCQNLVWCTNPVVWRAALPWRMKAQKVLSSVDTSVGLETLKAHILDSRYALTFEARSPNSTTSWVWTALLNDPATTNDNAFVGQKACRCILGPEGYGHHMAVVGWNDDIWVDVNLNGSVDAGEKGVLKIAESSGGTSKGNAGFYWMAYDALKEVSAVVGGPTNRCRAFMSGRAYCVERRDQPHAPRLLAEFTLQTARRSQVRLQFHRTTTSDSPPLSPTATWVPELFGKNHKADSVLAGFDGRNYDANPSAAPNGSFVFDLTDIAPTGDVTSAKWRYVMQIADLAAGYPVTVKSFKLIDATHGDATGSAANLPLSVDNTTQYVCIDYPQDPAPIAIQASVASVTVPEGGTATFQVRLSAQPAASVTVTTTRSAGDTNIAVSAGASRTFTTSNWSTYQTVTLAASEDNADNAAGTATITCSGSGLTSASLTATEADDDYTLTITASNGTVAKSPNSAYYDNGSSVQLTATPNAGYTFTGWSGAITGTANPASLTMNASKAVTASFGAAVPAAPSGLTAAALSSSQMRLVWTDNSGNETGFKVDRRQSGATNWVRVVTTAANVTTHVDSGLLAATKFYCQVKAYNAAGNSLYSNVADATTPAGSALAVHPSNPRYFMDATGRAIYLTGSHIWYNIHATGSREPMSYDQFELFLDRLQGYGHNHTRLWTGWVYTQNAHHPHPWNRPGPGTASDGLPKFDLTCFNQAYFDLVRERVLQMQARGMYCSVMFFGSFNGFRDDWTTIPWYAGNNINPETQVAFGSTNPSSFFTTNPDGLALQRALVRKFIDTLHDVDNLIWETMNEPGTQSFAWNDGIINYARAYEAGKSKQHLLGMTGGWKLGTNMLASHADWISPDWTDYKTGGPAAYTEKVVIVDTDHLSPWYDLAPEYVQPIRQWVWRTFTRGHHTLLMDNYGSSGFPSDYDSIRRAMGRTRAYAERFTDLAAMQPSTTLSSTAYCLANPGYDYLVYQSATNSFSVNLVAGAYDCEWFNVAAGQVAANLVCAAGGGNQTFSAPFAGESVLFLHRTDATPPPTPPSALTATALSSTQVRLAWQDNSSNETGFKIRRGTVSTNLSTEIVVAANATRYDDAGLAPSTTYHYKVKAQGQDGDSAYSAVVSATTPAGTGSGWTAYNDLAWTNGQIVARITTFGRGQGGYLLDYATGLATPARLTVSAGGSGPHMDQGIGAATGTDAHACFNGKVDCTGLINYSSNLVSLTFASLPISLRYEVVVFGNRATAAYTNRITKIGIRDMSHFRNASTSGSDFDGESDTSTAIVNGDNTANGFVGRFLDIDPGTDADFRIDVYDNESPAQPKFYVNAVMLRAYEPMMTSTGTQDFADRADEDGDGILDAWAAQFSLSGSAESDTDGDGSSDAAEFVAGTDPTDAASRFEIDSAVIRAGEFGLSLVTIEGKRYVVEYADTLPAGEWTELARFTGNGLPATVEDPTAASASARVYRVRVLE